METASVVCVLGMHRSGTSAVTRALNLLGMDLGLPECLVGPRENNPEGFWENLGFLEVSDQILTRQGGTWDEPPALTPGWERSPDLSGLRTRVAALVRENFSGRALWGWKDPRACLTLPFWQTLLPPMRYVLCIRSPLAVAYSLQKRDGFSIEKGGRLWLTHVISALTHTAGTPRLIVEYERLLTAPEREVGRLARFIGRPHGPEVCRAVEASVRQDLQHHRIPLADTLTARRLPFPARALYAQLHLAVSSAEVDAKDEILTLLARVAGEEQSAGFELQYRDLLADHRRLARDGEQLRADLQRLGRDREQLQSDLIRSHEALARIQGHPVWRAYRWLRSGLLPSGSWRAGAYLRTREWLEARRRTDT